MSYRVPDSFVPTVVSHGNSKFDKPFCPTLPSTKVEMVAERKVHDSKDVVRMVSVVLQGQTVLLS